MTENSTQVINEARERLNATGEWEYLFEESEVQDLLAFGMQKAIEKYSARITNSEMDLIIENQTLKFSGGISFENALASGQVRVGRYVVKNSSSPGKLETEGNIDVSVPSFTGVASFLQGPEDVKKSILQKMSNPDQLLLDAISSQIRGYKVGEYSFQLLENALSVKIKARQAS